MRRLFVAGALLLASLIPVSAAVAAPHHPTGEYAPFADCPLSKTNLQACLLSEQTGGYVKLGAKTVPIKNPVVLQGGYELTSTGTQFYGAEDGNTLSKTPQPVPGGLTGIVAPSWWPQILRDLFNETINNGFTGVTATVELAAPATSIKINPAALIERRGVSLFLPVKVKLSNPFLGSNCYIGSSSSPINLALTTGTTSPPPPNTPISGGFTGGSENPTGTIVTINGLRLVDNSFAAPGANGCGGLFSFLVDPFVNSIVGVPSAAGNNTAILEGTLRLAEPNAVRASE